MSKPMIATAIIWLCVTAGYGYATVAAKLALPKSPELYVHTVGYQVYQFVTLKAPAILILFTVVLVIQWFLGALRKSEVPPTTRSILRCTLWTGVGITLLLGLLHQATVDTDYNPYFQYDEQLALLFLTSKLPIIASVVAVILLGEHLLMTRKAG